MGLYPHHRAHVAALRAGAEDSRDCARRTRTFVADMDRITARVPMVLAGATLLDAAAQTAETLSTAAQELPEVHELQGAAADLWADAVEVFNLRVDQLNDVWAQADPTLWDDVTHPMSWLADRLDGDDHDSRRAALRRRLDTAYRHLEDGLDQTAEAIAATLRAGPGTGADSFYRHARELVAAARRTAQSDAGEHHGLWSMLTGDGAGFSLQSVRKWADSTSLWAYNHVIVPGVNGLADVVQAGWEHPTDIPMIGAGLVLMAAGGAGEAGGLALDLSGVGAAAGVPVGVQSAAAIAAGATMVGVGATDLVTHAAENDNRLLNESDAGKTPGRGKPREPLPDSARPSTAGKTWKGRVSDNGKGEVWQDPVKVDPPKGSPKDANEIRFSDPDERYRYGAVRFYNSQGQAIGLDGRPGGRAETHIPIKPDGSYPVPKGWNP